MPKIQKLPESLIRLIAAGEVIERPASVLKELVENSLDAGASQISIDIWGAGRSRIRVTDNGCGMSREDAEQALDRHATSKLRSFEDLQTLLSFGFRGEALPSIAAVSRLELTTREADSAEGWRLQVDGGTLISVQAAGVPPGTTIDVQDLFFNTPARAKFMKRDSTERAHMLRMTQDLALAHPHVRFDVTVDGKAALVLPPTNDLRSRLDDLWESTVTQHLVPLNFAAGPLAVEGFVNAVPAHQPTKSYQHLFVNRRPIQQRALNHAIYEAYHEWLPVGRHPAYVLYLTLDPTVLDINVHPTKREVRFSNERALYDALFHHIRKVTVPRQDVPVLRDASGETQPHVSGRETIYQQGQMPTSGLVQETRLTAELAMAAMVADAPTPSIATPRRFSDAALRVLGQFNRVYVLAEQGDELLIIDQHAAAERVMYERLLQSSRLEGAKTQRLLSPFIWDLPPDRVERVREAQASLQALGFMIDEFGGHSLALKEIPAVFPQLQHAKRFLDVFIESLEEESHDHEESAAHESVARAACRAAIKANDPLAPAEMQHLLKELAACERPMTCPHGRPTHIRLPLPELHRRFGRT